MSVSVNWVNSVLIVATLIALRVSQPRPCWGYEINRYVFLQMFCVEEISYVQRNWMQEVRR
jgi:hypothetical protein